MNFSKSLYESLFCLAVFLTMYIVLRYSPSKLENRTSFIIALIILLLYIVTSKIKQSVIEIMKLKVGIDGAKNNCQIVCDDPKKENFEESLDDKNISDANINSANISDANINSANINSANLSDKEIADNIINAEMTKKKNSEYQKIGEKSNKHIPINKTLLANRNEPDTVYSDINNLPVPKDYKYSINEYGYSFLPPSQWFDKPSRAPLCVIDNPEDRNKVAYTLVPGATSGLPINIKDFDKSRRFTGSAEINTNYISEKLNYK